MRFTKEELKQLIEENMLRLYRKTTEEATKQQLFQAVSFSVKELVLEDWMKTHKEYEAQDLKTVYYLSMEFLTGRA
ncbi:MAG: hypothetical protein MJ113_04395, partial [Lachnospiraceae bacterium]|nr:hypothetical protein [Lachnospiraceae bacterium]